MKKRLFKKKISLCRCTETRYTHSVTQCVTHTQIKPLLNTILLQYSILRRVIDLTHTRILHINIFIDDEEKKKNGRTPNVRNARRDVVYLCRRNLLKFQSMTIMLKSK